MNGHLHLEAAKVCEFSVNNQKLIQIMAPHSDPKLLKIAFSDFKRSPVATRMFCMKVLGSKENGPCKAF